MQTSPKYIGFIGAKAAGKTTAFNYLNKRFNNLNEVMIAKRLKEVCAAILNIPEDNLNRADLKEKKLDKPYFLTDEDLSYIASMFNLPECEKLNDFLGIKLVSPRQAAQYIGTNIVRVIDKDAHLNSVRDSAKLKHVNIVTDIRFPNELSYFKNLDGEFILVHIQRDCAEQAALEDGHESELHLLELTKSADIVIPNNSSINFLGQQLDLFCSIVHGKGGRFI